MPELPFTAPPRGFRLPDATRLGPVLLQVADLDRSIAYYERVVGLRTLTRAGARATLGTHGDPSEIVELEEMPGANPVPRRGRLGLYHFAILLPDRPALGRFVTHLADLGEYAGMSDHLVSEAVYLTDPDGLGIEVYADRPRSAWPRNGQALAMATDPIDLAALRRAAAGEPWTGVPPGATIGHVHLFVADLALAAAFFHHGLGLDRVLLGLPGALFLSAGGYHHHLGTNTWAAEAPTARQGDARLLEWRVRVPTHSDVQAAGRSLEAAGYAIVRDGATVVAADPWGTAVRISGGTSAASNSTVNALPDPATDST